MKQLSTRTFAFLAGMSVGLGVLPGAARAEDAVSPGSSGEGVPPEAATARAEYDGPPTLVRGSRRPKLGGYAGIGGAYTHMLGRDGGLMSLEAGLLLDHRFSVGLAGYGFTRTPSGPPDADGTPRQFATGYGGVAVRYSIVNDLPVYATLGFVAGGGAVALDQGIGDDQRSADRSHHGSADPFFVFQPELAVQSNVTRWFRVGVTGGYRFAAGVNQYGLRDSDLSGPVVGGNLQFGWL